MGKRSQQSFIQVLRGEGNSSAGYEGTIRLRGGDHVKNVYYNASCTLLPTKIALLYNKFCT